MNCSKNYAQFNFNLERYTNLKIQTSSAVWDFSDFKI